MAYTGIKLTDIAQGDAITKEEEINGIKIEGKLEGYDGNNPPANITINIYPEKTPTTQAHSYSVAVVVDADGNFTGTLSAGALDETWNTDDNDDDDGHLWFEATDGTLKSELRDVLFDPDDRIYRPEETSILFEDGQTTTATGNALANDKPNVNEGNGTGNENNPYSDGESNQNPVNDSLAVVPGTLVYTSATEELGQLTIDQNGDYTYVLDNAKAQHLSQGEMDAQTYDFDVTDAVGNIKTEKITISVMGQNDAATVEDFCDTGLEGDAPHQDPNNYIDGGPKVTDGKVDQNVGDATVYQGELQVDDPDTHDEHKFKIIGGSGNFTLTSDDVDPALLDATIHFNENTGRFMIDGDFDALGAGEEACITFQYKAEEYYDKNANGTLEADEKVGESNIATAKIKIVGTNDQIEANDDYIITYTDLPTGNIYEAVLRNDVDLDVNDKMYIDNVGKTANTKAHSIIDLDMANELLRYTPNHVDATGVPMPDEFTYTVYDREGTASDLTSTKDTATVHINVLGANGQEVDNYITSSGCNNNTYCGTDENDLIAAGAGSDTINGKAGDDLLYGNGGQDRIYGGDGNDVLVGGADSDHLEGGAGNDVYYFNKGDGADCVVDLEGENKIVLGATVDYKDVAFYLDLGADNTLNTADDALKIKYTDGDCNDIITIKGKWQDIKDHFVIQIDTPEDASNNAGVQDRGLNATDLQNIIDDINTWNTTNDPDVTNVCEVQNTANLMTQINNEWQVVAAIS